VTIQTLGRIAALTLLVTGSRLMADSLSATDSGWYAANGLNANGDVSGFENYAVGYDNGDFNPGQILRDFFVFDLSSVSGDITAATLDLYVPASGTDAGPGYQSNNSSEEYLLTGTDSAISDLTGSYGAGDATGQSIYDTLGTGTTYADVSIVPGDQGTTIDISLNSDGLAYLNANEGSQVAFSGQNPNVVTTNGLELYFTYTNPTDISVFSGTPEPTLDITFAPEPASPALMITGLAVIGVALLRRRTAPSIH
jgi:hypothetical protein